MRLQERLGGVRLDPRPLPLEPFGHQVAGQASMLTLDPGTVCKPLIPREHRLYCTLPPALRPFTPHYHGVLYVQLEEGEDGSLNLWGYRPLTQDSSSREVLTPPPSLTDDARDKTGAVRTFSTGPSTREQAEDNSMAARESALHKKGGMSGEPPVKNRQTSGTPASTDPDPRKDPADRDSKVGKRSPPHRSSQSNNVRADGCHPPSSKLQPSSSRDDDDDDDDNTSEDLDKDRTEVREDPTGKVKDGRGGQGMRGEDGSVQRSRGTPSGRNGGTSRPVSSGSGQDVSSAVDHTPFPSRPSSGCMVRVTEDGEYQVTAGQAADSKFLTMGDDLQAPRHTAPDSNPRREAAAQPLNPWGLSLHTRLLDKMRKSQPSLSGYPFLVLENVVGGFSQPCILDLKVGSRLYGDDASAKKRASQSRKCNITTSRSLGLRLCGMQVYQVTTGTYHSLDKFHGRTLTDDTFYDVLRDFLHNGREVRRELLAPIVARLHALIDCLKELDSFRFYASSLLIMYDGLSPPHGAPQEERTCVPDSGREKSSKGAQVPSSGAHVPESGSKGACVPKSGEKGASVPISEEDHKAVKGADVPSCVDRPGHNVRGGSVERTSPCSNKEKSDSNVPPPSVTENCRSSDRVSQPSSATHSRTTPHTTPHGTSNDDLDLDPDKTGVMNDKHLLSSSVFSSVDVRMIDFAHTTHSGFHDNVTHEGPDSDYIWGLENLTRMFSQLLTEQE